MSLTATARSVPGTLRQDVLVGRGHGLTTDEPERLGGTDAGPAPHELLPAALAACVSTTLVAYARARGWALHDVAVAVDYDNRATPRAFDVAIDVAGDLDAAQLERLEAVAAACPVRRALEAGFAVSERLHHVPDASHEAAV